MFAFGIVFMVLGIAAMIVAAVSGRKDAPWGLPGMAVCFGVAALFQEALQERLFVGALALLFGLASVLRNRRLAGANPQV